MNLYTKKAVNILAIIFTILIYFILTKINFQNFNIEKVIFSKEVQEIQNEDIQEEVNENEQAQESLKNNKENNEQINNEQVNNEEYSAIEKYDWGIYIPVIDLVAQIEESVEKEVMNRSVGHFSNTPKWEGNVGLGAHNRGYKVNYFQNIKKLKMEDRIFYKYDGLVKQYLVSNIVIIKDTDWSYLEQTEENRITLITCVENEPNYRRCIQGIEKE